MSKIESNRLSNHLTKRISFEKSLCNIAVFVFYAVAPNANKTSMLFDLKTHPNYPSLLSLSDVLSKYNVVNFSIKPVIDKEYFKNGFRCVIYTSGEFKNIYFVYSIEGQTIKYIDMYGSRLEGSLSELQGLSLSALLVLQPGNKFPISFKLIKNNFLGLFFLRPVFALSSMISGLVLLFLALYLYGAVLSLDTVSYLWMTLSLCGMGASGVLVYLDYFRKNMKSGVCASKNKNINCDSVLSSGGVVKGISVSLFGLSYFISTFIFYFLFINIFEEINLFFSRLSLLFFPVIVFSVIYQWKFAQKWCTYCLLVQAVLLSQVFISIYVFQDELLYFNDLFLLEYFSLGILFFVVYLAAELFKKTCVLKSDTIKSRHDLNRLKLDNHVFKSLLSNSKKVSTFPQEAKLKFFHESIEASRFEVDIVCNPYCIHCGSYLRKILVGNTYALRGVINILFSVDLSDMEQVVAVSYLSGTVNSMSNYGDKIKVINDWYSTYENPSKILSKEQEIRTVESLKENDKWLEVNSIYETPTVICGDRVLPLTYEAEDILFMHK